MKCLIFLHSLDHELGAQKCKKLNLKVEQLPLSIWDLKKYQKKKSDLRVLIPQLESRCDEQIRTNNIIICKCYSCASFIYDYQTFPLLNLLKVF